MLRVVLCIICLHPFLGVFLFALLYHTIKDFSRVNFAENVRVLHGFGFFGRSTGFQPPGSSRQPISLYPKGTRAFAPLRFAACSTSDAKLVL